MLSMATLVIEYKQPGRLAEKDFQAGWANRSKIYKIYYPKKGE